MLDFTAKKLALEINVDRMLQECYIIPAIETEQQELATQEQAFIPYWPLAPLVNPVRVQQVECLSAQAAGDGSSTI